MTNSKNLSEVLAQLGFDEGVTHQFSAVEFPFALMPHQIDGLHRTLYYPRYGLYFEPRTGKTLTLQATAIFFAAYGGRIMQVMPPGLLYQFMADYKKIKHHGLKIHILNQGVATRKKLFVRWETDCPNVVLMSSVMFKTHWRDLYALNFRHLHFDEAHLVLQDHANKTSQAVKSFLKQSEGTRLVLSTGTPIPNRIENAYGLVSLTNPTAYSSARAFDLSHVVRKQIRLPGQIDAYGRQRSIQVVDHYINLERLSQSIYERGIHASQRDILRVDAPNIQVVECDLTPPHRKLYKEVLQRRIIELEDGEVIDVRSAQKLRQTALQLISCPENYGGHPTHNSLYDTLESLLEPFKEKEKVVVFANFTRTVELLRERLRSWSPVTVYGPNGPTKNAQNVEVFKTHPACRMLIANPVAGGTGFTLGEVCTTIVFAEPVESPGAFQQCVSRVLLVGQTTPVLCYIVKAVKTISAMAIDHMVGKAVDINEVMRLKKTVFEVLINEKTNPEDAGN